MTQIKFICPSCGQHIQCNPECVSQNVPCPACASLVRVPADAELADAPPLSADANPFQAPEKPKVSATNPRPAPRVDNKPVSAIREELDAPLPTAQSPELRCTCPVCHSDLRISVTVKSNASLASIGDKHSQSAAFQQAGDQLSAADREKKIAAAREANRVTPYPVIKPRLDKILSKESAKLEFDPPQQPNSAEEYQPEIDPDQIFRSHNSE